MVADNVKYTQVFPYPWMVDKYHGANALNLIENKCYIWPIDKEQSAKKLCFLLLLALIMLKANKQQEQQNARALNRLPYDSMLWTTFFP